MRNKKPMNNGGYNQRHKPRFQQGGSSQGHQHSHNRPRRNYSAAREKYLSQARDALASGDRVLAENYLQHAEHCYRMMVEEGALRPQQPRPQATEGEAQPQGMEGDGNNQDFQPANSGALPAFITGGYDQQAPKPVDPATVQNWEERDA